MSLEPKTAEYLLLIVLRRGIEPPRGYLSIKKSKKGPLKQIVPQYQSLKNNYTLLWDMPSNTGYINVVAVMQKFFDQAISGNWSYNPENYDDNEVPVSVMANDFLKTYTMTLRPHEIQKLSETLHDSLTSCMRAYELGLYL